MTCSDRRLWLALVISLTLHALPLLADLIHVRSVPKTLPPLMARLTVPPPPPPELILPEPVVEAATPPPAAEKPKPRAKPAVPVSWNKVVQRQLQQLQATGRFYSPEAIAQNLEGDPVVLFVLDTAGNVSAARIEESSGHALLDRDALRAVRSLRALPAETPREVLLPLRFRLKD